MIIFDGNYEMEKAKDRLFNWLQEELKIQPDSLKEELIIITFRMPMNL